MTTSLYIIIHTYIRTHMTSTYDCIFAGYFLQKKKKFGDELLERCDELLK